MGSAGIFPTHNAQACIWVSQPASEARAIRHAATHPLDALHTMIRKVSPRLLVRTRAADVASTVHGQIGLPNHRRQSTGNGWALVGDAAYHRDAITGHGISDALRDADLLARAVRSFLDGTDDEATAMARYAHEQHRLMRDIFELTLRFVEFPPSHEFIDLQIELSRAIECQAQHLALTRLASTR